MSEPSVSITFPAVIENLSRLIGPVLEVAARMKLGAEKCHDLELALEESLVNIFNYAYPETAGAVTVDCTVTADRLVIRIEDEGVPFSVTESDPPDLSSTLLERKIGGLGIHLVRTLMDKVSHSRVENVNRLELTLFIPSGEGTE